VVGVERKKRILKGEMKMDDRFKRACEELNMRAKAVQEEIQGTFNNSKRPGFTNEKGDFIDSLSYGIQDREHIFPNDEVNHPKHYTTHPSGVECIEIAEHLDFCIGNAIKYLWRAGLKDEDTSIVDLQKAIFYINRKIKLLDEKGGN